MYDRVPPGRSHAGTTGPEGDGPSLPALLLPAAWCLLLLVLDDDGGIQRQRHHVPVPGTDQYNTIAGVGKYSNLSRAAQPRCEVNGVAEEHGRQWHLPHGIASFSVYL